MSELKTERKTYICVCDYELEAFIKEKTGHEFCIVSNVECGNDTELSYRVGPNTDLDDWNEFKETGSGCYLPKILDGLCTDGLIDAGDYLITVSW